MSRFMCFRPQKKNKENDAYAAISKDDKTNVAPNSRMVSKCSVHEGLSMLYVTPRIVVLTAPDEGTERAYKESLKAAALALKAKHYQHFKVWSVSKRRHDVSRALEAIDCGWPNGLAPPLDRLCSMCKQIEQWLLADSANIAVLHCKGARNRAAMIISAYMYYNAICSAEENIEERICMQRFADRYIGSNGQPSLTRYIKYFSSLISGRIRVNSSPLFLIRIGVSNMNGRQLVFKIYERLCPVYETDAFFKQGENPEVTYSKPTRLETLKTTKDVTKWEIEGELRIRGDILVKCMQIQSDRRAELFICQLNTCSLELTGKTAALTFHKEDLDRVYNDSSFDNQAVLELLVSLEPPKLPPVTKNRLSSMGGRKNSYEDFDIPEDDATSNAVVYSEIRKDTKQLHSALKTPSEGSQSDDTTTTDSDPKSTLSSSKMPPPVPPKPRSESALAEPIAEVPERRGVLPAQVRPLAHRPPSPGRATPSIEPDLVGKDRYDKASKCFSYAPTKELAQAFERPRRPSFSRAVERAEDQVNHVDPVQAARVEIPHSNDERMSEPPPKWDDQVERTKQEALIEELSRSRMPTRSQSVAAQPYYRRDYDDEVEEKPLIVDQAQRAVTTTTPTGTLNRNRTNYGSYRTLNDDKYSSHMDDLCDPEFYLNYKAPEPPVRAPHAGAKSVELPRRRFQPVEAFTDPLDEILNSTGPAPAASCVDLRDRDAFRNRNCKSVATTPSRDRRIFADRYDSVNDAQDPDDWLTNKLKKVRSKRDLDPDLVRRRTQEKMLLEELKNAHDDRENIRGREEASYSVEGYGTAQIDPLAEYRREEERLKNTHSPFQDMPRSRSRQVRSKPPTPPPRERSRSPTRSEIVTPSIENQYSTMNSTSSYRHQNGFANGYQEPFDFSTLNSIVQPNQRNDSGRRSTTLGRRPSYGSDRPPFQYSSDQFTGDLPTKFYSGQERVAAAIYRAETPQREIQSGGTLNRPETPSARYFPDNSSFVQRSATPSFPVTRETPIPFHPLLYSQNGASRGDLDRSHTLNYRSSSPRSQYGQLSRRSSMTSVDTSEIIHHHPVFVKDTSKYWYKPMISREQAINMLRDKAPGTFVVRDSNSFPGAFGLALKVATPPAGVAPGDGTELVRHFLIEPSPKGVKLKGCNNEPVFGSLSALVYQHSITPLALPTKLILPEYDPATTPEHVSATQALLEQGAACNVSYIGSIDVESLTGGECVRRAVARTVEDVQMGEHRAVSVHFKVSSQGVTLTDNTRKVFFRRHFPVSTVIFAGMDPSDRRFDNYAVLGYHDGCVPTAKLFAFVARKPSSMENACHVFAELEPEQPASAVVNFINKVMLASRRN